MWASPAKAQFSPFGIKTNWQTFSFNAPVFLMIIQHGSNQTLIISANLLFALFYLRQASTIFKQNPSSQQHPSGLSRSLYSWNKQSCWGGRKWHKYLSFNKREKQKQKKHREEVEQKKLMAVLVLGQQCTPGNYKHKGKNLGLYSTQLSQIIERVHGNKKRLSKEERWNRTNSVGEGKKDGGGGEKEKAK